MSTNEDRMAQLDAWIAEAETTHNHKDIKFGLLKLRMARERMLREFQDGIDELAAIDKPAATEPARTASGRRVRKDKDVPRGPRNNTEVMALQLKEAP